MAVYAMEQGKHVAVEVPAAVTVEECWKLVDTAEKTRRHCMMLENCCYDFFELATLNMAQQGLFGEVVHTEGAYNHDLRGLCMNDSTGYHDMWRLEYNAAHDGNPLVAGRQRGGVKAVTPGACHGQGIASLQRSQLAGALALDLIQKGQCAGLAIKIVHADGTGQNRRGVRRPGTQHIKLARMGFAAGILPLHDQAHDIGCDNFLTQDR